MGQYDGWYTVHSASVVSQTNTQATIRVTCYWQNSGWNYNVNGVYAYVSCNGSEVCVKNGTWVDSTASNSAKVSCGSHDFTINKSTAAQSISCYARINCTSSYSPGNRSSSATSVSVSAKPSYTVSYNANGGSGAPSSQTKWYGTSLTLSSSKPSRTGYTFSKWNTKSDGSGTSYNAGASYTGNAALTLYAIWTANTYTVSYNANGGSGAPSSQTKTYGKTLTLSSTIPTRTNYNFKGWSTSASGSVVYAAGASYTNNAAVTLYAVWELAYVKPRITSFKAQRCNSSGTASESGTYVKVTFNWATDKTVSEVGIQYRLQTASNYTGTTVTASGTSGSVSQVVGSGGISTESSYYVRAYVKDSGGTTRSSDVSIGTVKFPIDVKKGGTGVAIGKVAETDNLFDVNPNARFRGTVTVDGGITGNASSASKVYGTLTNPTSATNYYVPFYSNSGSENKSLRTNDGIRYRTLEGTTSAAGLAILVLGNGVNTGTAGNKYGMLRLQSPAGSYADLRYTTSSTSSVSHYLPTHSGYLKSCTNLYSNSTGTTGTVTLSETSANFDYLDIYYYKTESELGGKIYGHTRVFAPNSKMVTLQLVHVATNTISQTLSRLVNISGTSITFKKEILVNFTVGTQTVGEVSSVTDAIYITRVDGWK